MTETSAITWAPGEVPAADEVSTPFWDATREHRYTVQQCSACQHVQYPPKALCTGCGSMENLTQVDSTGEGVVDTFSVIHRAPRADVEVPYTIARVRLAEGPIVLTRLEPAEPGESGWTIGDAVTLDWVDLPDGRALPYHRRATQA